MSVKTFKLAGISLHKGQYRVRYANDANRARVLEKNGHTEVELIALDEALAQEDIIDRLLNHSFKTPAANDAIRIEARKLGFIL
jgi:hypothetical protein